MAMSNNLKVVAAVCGLFASLVFAVACGGGGDGGGGAPVPQTPAQVLTNLTANGGGIGGAAVASGGDFHARVLHEASLEPMPGAGVSLNDATGAVIASAITNASGDATFTGLASVPASVTFVRPDGGSAQSFHGTPQNPLRTVIVATFGMSPSFDLTVTGITPGTDLQLRLNGSLVGARDNCAATEQFTITSVIDPPEGVFSILDGLLDPAFVGHNQPWLLIAHEYQNDTPTTPDSADLLRAAWLSDSNGTAGGTGSAAVLTLDLGTGAGTTGNGLSSGLCTVATATGNITASSSQFGFPPTLVGLPNVVVTLENGFGSFPYSRLMIDPNDLQNIQNSLIAPLPLLGASVPYSVEYPELPAGFTEGAWDSDQRTAQIALGSSAAFLAIAQGTPEDLTNLLATLTILFRRAQGTTVGGARDISLASLGTLGSASVAATVTTDTISGTTPPGLLGLMMARVDTDSAFFSFGAGVGNVLGFPAVGRVGSPMPVTDARFAAFAGDTNGTIGGYAVTHFPRGSTAGLASLTASVIPVAVTANFSLGGPLTLDVISPATGSTTFNLATDAIEWTGGGLASRMGVFVAELTIDTGTPTARTWEMTINRAAVSTAGGSSYSVRVPTLPTGAPFDAMAVTSAAATMAVSIRYFDTTAAGINPDNFSFNSIEPANTSSFVPDAVAAAPRFSEIRLIEPAAVNPE